MPLIVLFLLVVFILIVLFTRIKIVPQSNIYVVERLGKFYAAWETGVHFLCPFLDRVAKRVSIKEQVVDFKPQPVITKDNVTMQIDTVVFFQITNPVQFAYGVERPLAAIENLTATTLRNIIGELAFLMSTGGSMFFSSTRMTLIPQRSVAWSMVSVIFVLIRSREFSVASNSSSPMMLPCRLIPLFSSRLPIRYSLPMV